MSGTYYGHRSLLPLFALFGGLIVSIATVDRVENTFRGTLLFAWAAAVGFIVGAACGTYYLRPTRTPRFPLSERMAGILCMAVGLGLATASAASYDNSRDGVVEHHAVLVDRKTVGGKSRTEAYVSVTWNGREERLRVSWPVWHSIAVGTTALDVCVRSGRLGYEYVCAVNEECSQACRCK